MKTVHVVGDSISIQYGPYLEKYLASSIHYSRKAGKVGNLDVPEGANGGDSTQVLAYLDQCLAEGKHWAVLLLNCGLHDIRRYDVGRYQVSPAEYEQNVSRILAQAKTLADQIVWIGTTPLINTLHNTRTAEFERFNEDVEMYNEIADRVAAAQGAAIIDLYAFCHALGGAELYQDHVHFTPPVQQLQAAFIAGYLHGQLAIPH